MRVTKDTELNGYAIVCDGIQDLLATAAKNDSSEKMLRENQAMFGLDPSFTTYKNLTSWSNKTWHKGIEQVNQIATRMRNLNPPAPVHTQRRRRYSENLGDLEVERLIQGSDTHHREMFREKRPKNMTVAMMTDVGAGVHVSNYDLMCRGAALLVACDLLEEAGYTCEVWGYFISNGCYSSGSCGNAFVCYQIKQAGDPVDVDTMAKGVSPEIFRTAILECMPSSGQTLHSHYGRPNQSNRERWFGRHCGMDTGVEKLWVPPATGFDNAVTAVKKMVEEFQAEG